MALMSDVLIKLLDPGAPIFQFAFLRCVLTLLLLLPLAKKNRPPPVFCWHRQFNAIRAHVHLIGMLCMIIRSGQPALGHRQCRILTPRPLLVMLLSVVIFRERLTLLSVIAVFSGFAGINPDTKTHRFHLGRVCGPGLGVFTGHQRRTGA